MTTHTMSGYAGKNITKRLIVWAIAIALLLMIPLILTKTGSGIEGEGVYWTGIDFVVMGVMLFGAASIYELATRKMHNPRYRMAVGLAVVSALLLLWGNLAVGLIGDGPINLLYLGVIALGFLGAIIVRFQSRGLSKVLFLMAVAQFVIPIIALVVREPDFAPGVMQVFILNSVFVVLFIGSGLLFRQASTNS